MGESQNNADEDTRVKTNWRNGRTSTRINGSMETDLQGCGDSSASDGYCHFHSTEGADDSSRPSSCCTFCFCHGLCRCGDSDSLSNEFLLSTAFISFLAFTIAQLFGAIIAESEAMMADTAAMMVDAFTYGFNLYAEQQKPNATKVQKLQLELIAPLISVSTLVVVNIFVMRKSIMTILNPIPLLPADQPKLIIMFAFSTLNLMLDIFNVTCFARANRLFGYDIETGAEEAKQRQNLHHHLRNEDEDEEDGLHSCCTSDLHTNNGPSNEACSSRDNAVTRRNVVESAELDQSTRSDEEDSCEGERTNLNMCSAYTHVFADTLRSIAVIVASCTAYKFTDVKPDQADAIAALVVSFLIFLSLIPLVQGLNHTFSELKYAKAELEAQEDMTLRVSSQTPRIEMQAERQQNVTARGLHEKGVKAPLELHEGSIV